MASAATMASLRIPCVRQNFGGSSSRSLIPHGFRWPSLRWRDWGFLFFAEVGVSKEIGVRNRLALLHAVVAQSEVFLATRRSD